MTVMSSSILRKYTMMSMACQLHSSCTQPFPSALHDSALCQPREGKIPQQGSSWISLLSAMECKQHYRCIFMAVDRQAVPALGLSFYGTGNERIEGAVKPRCMTVMAGSILRKYTMMSMACQLHSSCSRPLPSALHDVRSASLGKGRSRSRAAAGLVCFPP